MKKETKTLCTERTFTFGGTLVPINFLFLMILFVIGGGYAPTAVVMNDRGPYAQQFYQAMSGAHSFRLQQSSTQEAEELLRSGRIVAGGDPAAGFLTHLAAHRSFPGLCVDQKR